jgi:Nif-specific regulatory protein
VGFFEAANKGTIFLDEIGELPIDIQVKLLHVLQNKVIYRVGSSKPIKVDVRVIAATNRNLEEEVAQGRFRQDLYYRINVFPIEIPPIRERKGDLYLLINQLMKNICDDYGLEAKMFSGEALQKMISYNWPGNVRELENVIERAITLCDSNIIYGEHLRIGKGNIPRTMKEMLAKEEERILEMTLLKYNGNKQKAMEELDMSRSIFYDKLKKYNIKY